MNTKAMKRELRLLVLLSVFMTLPDWLLHWQ